MAQAQGVNLSPTLSGSDNLLRAVIESTPNNIFWKDINGVFVGCNRNFLKARGYKDFADIIGKTTVEITRNPAEATPAVNADAKVIETGMPVLNLEEQVQLPDGSTKTFIVNKVPLMDAEGQARGLIGISTDITERKLAEADLTASEQRFRNLIEGSIQGIHIHRNFRPIFANQACADIFGYDSPEDILALPSTIELIDPLDRDCAENFGVARLRGEDVPNRYEIRGLKKDGSLIWLEQRARVVEWDGAQAIQIVQVDITERKNREQELLCSERRYRDLVEGSIQGVFIHKEFRPLFANQSAANMFGYDNPDEVLALDSVVPLIALEDRERVAEYAKKRLAGEHVPDHYEMRAVRKDGSVFWVEHRVRIVEWEGEQAVQLTIVDISERKQSEAALIEAHNTLEQKVEDRTKALTDEIAERKAAEAKHRASEEKYRQLVDCMLDGVFLAQDDKFIFVNDGFARMIGYSVEEMTNQPAIKFVAEEDRKKVLERHRKRVAGKKVVSSYEFNLLKKDGVTTVPVLMNVARISTPDDRPASLGTLKDISDLKHAENALRDSEALFRAVLDNAAAIINLKDADGRFLLVNKEYEKCFGIGAEKALGKTSSEIRGPKSAATSLVHEKAVMKTGKPVVFEKQVDYSVDGDLRDYHIVKFPVKDENGKVSRVGTFAVDITERKTIENALRESEDRLLAIADNSSNTIVLKNTQGRILFANKVFADDFDHTPDEVIGKTIRELRDDGEPTRLIEQSDVEVIETGKPVSMEFDLVHKGNFTSRKLDKYPILDDQGKVKQIASIGTDISERIVMERALRESEERFRGFAETSADWLWETDADGLFTFVSSRIFDVLGLHPDAFLGRTAPEFCKNITLADSTKTFGKLVKQRKPFREIRYLARHTDGSWRTLRTSGQPRFDENGDFLGYRGTTTDVTSEVEARENEAKVQERFLTSIETVPMALALFNADDRLVVANQHYCDLLVSDVGNDESITFEDIIRAEVKSGAIKEAIGQEELWIRKRLESHRNPSNVFELSRKNGTFRIREHRTADNYTLVISNNITEQKKSEELLVQARDELEVRVFERTHALEQEIFERKYAQAELIKANEELERRVDERTKHLQDEVAERKRFEAQLVQAQKMEAVGQMAGGIAHDFNNLLTVVLANLGWLQEFTENNVRAKRMTNLALEGARRAGELTQRMLAFSRRQELNPVTIDLKETLDRFQPLISRALGETVSFEMSLDDNLWPVSVDPNQFESSILNIAINARDAMVEGGKFTLNIKNRPAKTGSDLTIANETGDSVEITLTDTGCGIPPETLKRVFDPFFTTKDIGRGSGLGLSMVFGFAKQSGGFVEINSKQEKGTEVRLVLPRAEAKKENDGALKTKPEAVETDGMQVLVVEDDEMVRNVTVEYLKMAGLSVKSAENADFALAALENDGPVDLVISDVIMPGTSGVELASKLEKRWPDTRIVLMTGYSYDEFSRRGIDPQSMKLLRKPFSRNELMDTINKAMQ